MDIIHRVEKIDDLTVRFHTQIPFAPFLKQSGAAIAPKHISGADYK